MNDVPLRRRLVEVALEWQSEYGIAPAITSALSEFDAASLIGMSSAEYSHYMRDRTAVSRGHDFVWDGARYQVKSNRPSGKSGSRVTLVPKAHNYEWDWLIWILYDRHFAIEEAWLWSRDAYREQLDRVSRLSPVHLRAGTRLA